MKQQFDSEDIEEFFKYASDKNGPIWHCIKRRLNWPLDDVVEFQWKRDCFAKALYASGNSISITFTPNNNCAMTLDVVIDGKNESIVINESEWWQWLHNIRSADDENDSLYQRIVWASVFIFSRITHENAKNLLSKAIKDEHKWAIMEKIYDKMAEDREHFNDNWTLKCKTSILAVNIRYISIKLGVDIQNGLALLFVKGGAKTGPKVNKPSRYTFQDMKDSYNKLLHGSDFNKNKGIMTNNPELYGDIEDFIDKNKCPEKRKKLLAYLEDNYVFPYVKELLASQK